MAELANGGLIRHRLAAQIDADKPSHRARVVHRLFHRRIGEVEPVLQEMDLEHPLNANRRAPGAFALRIKWLDYPAQSRPWNDLVHLLEKLLPARRLAKLPESFVGQRALAHQFNFRAA